MAAHNSYSPSRESGSLFWPALALHAYDAHTLIWAKHTHKNKINEKFKIVGAGEIIQRLRALVTLSGDPGSNPSTHMVVHNCL